MLKLKSVNIETVDKTPIACFGQCAFVIKNQFLVGPEPVSVWSVFKCINVIFTDHWRWQGVMCIYYTDRKGVFAYII